MAFINLIARQLVSALENHSESIRVVLVGNDGESDREAALAG
jgi:hypothetical protein